MNLRTQMHQALRHDTLADFLHEVDSILAQSPRQTEALAVRAECRMALDDAEGAAQDIAALEAVVNDMPKSAERAAIQDVIVDLQIALYGKHMDDFEGAMAAYERGQGHSANRLLLLAEVQTQHGFLEDATQTYTQIVYNEPTQSDEFWLAHWGRGDVYLERGLLPPAIQDFTRYISHLETLEAEQQSGWAQALSAAHTLRGLALLRNKQPAEAVADLEKALDYNPQNEDAASYLEEARPQALAAALVPRNWLWPVVGVVTIIATIIIVFFR